ncbi:MAG: hypothetical protein AAF791_04485 [Bacteroidota bacterium]
MPDASNPLSIYRTTDGWRWRLTADNGEIVDAATEGFHDRAEAIANLRRSVELGTRALAMIDAETEPEGTDPKSTEAPPAPTDSMPDLGFDQPLRALSGERAVAAQDAFARFVKERINPERSKNRLYLIPEQAARACFSFLLDHEREQAALRRHEGHREDVLPSWYEVENYIRDIPWSADATEGMKTLIAGNIRAFAGTLGISDDT